MTNNSQKGIADYRLLVDMVENILRFSDNPGSCAGYLTTQIRDLIGVRIVAIIDFVTDESGTSHKLIGICPSSKEPYWNQPEIQDFVSRVSNYEKPCLIDPTTDLDGKSLSSLGIGKSFVIPLCVGSERLGMIILLDLMEPKGASAILETIDKISGVFALILKNSLLYRNLENTVEIRTRTLKEQYSTLRSIIDSANALVFSVDREYRYTSFNKGHAAKMKAIYGVEIEEGHSLLDYMTVPEDRETARHNLDRALAGEHIVEEAYSGEELRSRLYFQVSHNPIKTEEEEIIGVAVLAQDMTERKRTEEALHESERHLRSVITAAPLILWDVDRAGTILLSEGNALAQLGLKAGERVGQSVFEVYKNDPKAVALIRRGLAGEEFRDEVQVGGRYWSNHYVPRRDKKGNVLGLIGVSADITELKQAEDEIRRLNAELEQKVIERTTELNVKTGELLDNQKALLNLVEDLNGVTSQLEATNKELEAFSYSVSHDLRAPLRAIEGFSQALLEDYKDKLDEQGRDNLNRVCGATQKMSQLIDAMLSLSRLTRGVMKREAVDLSALARTIADELQKTQPDRKVEFVIAEGVTANGDATMLRIVLENFLGNAWKFTGKHPSARIEFGVKQVDGKTAYFVRDDGAGFDIAYADKLFIAFQRLHTEAEFPGIGIGLATVQRIIHRHGGRVWAEGEVEKGATFYFTI